MMKQSLSLGVRLNNPGNIEWGSPWQGLVPRAQSMYAKTGNRQQKRFCQFKTSAYGIRAIAVTLITYYDKRKAKNGSKIDTPREIIERWAPAFENDVDAYASRIGRALCGTGTCERPADVVVDMHDYDQLRAVVEAIIRHENGVGPLKTANEWYDAATIDEALRMAGVRRAGKAAGPVPVTRETVAATGTAGVGISQLAEVAPDVMDAVTNAQDSLTSGQVGRIVVGLVLVGLAIFIAWSQVSKHKAGVL